MKKTNAQIIADLLANQFGEYGHYEIVELSHDTDGYTDKDNVSRIIIKRIDVQPAQESADNGAN